MTSREAHPAPVLAIDIGGTKIATGLVEHDGRVSGVSVESAPETLDPGTFLAAVLSCTDRSLTAAGAGPGGIAGVGCGCPGPMAWPDGRVSPINIPAWRDFPLAASLRQRFPGLPVRVHNDAVAMTAGEHWLGAGRGVSNMVVITVSTGVGGGLVLDNRLFSGGTGNGGHIGHITVDPNGPVCNCGAIGCLEAFACGPKAVEWALTHGWVVPDGEKATGEALARSATAGDATALQALGRAGRAVGVALSISAGLLDLDLAVVGGGFARSGVQFWTALDEGFHQHARLPFASRLRIVPSGVIEHSGLVGPAAFLLRPDIYGFDA